MVVYRIKETDPQAIIITCNASKSVLPQHIDVV